MMRNRRISFFAAAAVCLLFVAGCGGGGGEKKALSGSVSDVAGNLVPGAAIYLDGKQVTTSLSNGTYKIFSLSSGSHNVEARAMVDGRLWAGTRAVDVFSDGPTMNMNVVIGRWDELGSVEGTVTDVSNNPIAFAHVIAVARFPQNRPADEASVISKVEVADNNGYYKIEDLPASITVNGTKEDIIYDVIASSAGVSGQPRGFANQTKTATVAGGYVTRCDFSLLSSSTVVPPVPTDWTASGAIDVISYTVPTGITSRSVESAYDAVKSCVSEKSRKAIALKRHIKGRSAPLGNLIENNVIWYSIWNGYFGIDVPDNLAGFTIYRGTTGQLTQTSQFRIDFFRDPSIVTYADASRDLTAGVTYWYGVTAVSTSYLDAHDQFNPVAESDMSYPASVTPLDKLTALSPKDNVQVDAHNAAFEWRVVQGAMSYKVFVYDTYPILDALFTPQGDIERPDHLPAWGESAQTSGTSVTYSSSDLPLVSGHQYWWVVMASNASSFDSGNAYAISELRSFVAR